MAAMCKKHDVRQYSFPRNMAKSPLPAMNEPSAATTPSMKGGDSQAKAKDVKQYGGGKK